MSLDGFFSGSFFRLLPELFIVIAAAAEYLALLVCWSVVQVVCAVPIPRVDVRIEAVFILIVAIALSIARLLLEFVRHEIDARASMDHPSVVGLQRSGNTAFEVRACAFAIFINMMEQELLKLE